MIKAIPDCFPQNAHRIRPILFPLMFIASWPAATFAMASFNQSSPSEVAIQSEQTADANSTNTEAGGNQSVGHRKSPKTLIEAVTGGEEDTNTTESVEKERLDPDRPHLPEASTTVGKGRVMLEGGYTFNKREASSFSASDAPEAVFRAGVFAEWFEVRLGQSLLKQERSVAGTTSKIGGLQDLYLGAKIALNEQKRYLPEIALIPQMTVPTGSHQVTGGRVLPGLNVDGNWEMIPHRYSVEFVVANNRVSDDSRHSHFEFATGITHALQITDKIEVFGEWDVFKGSIEPGTPARHYAVGGLVFFATNNFAVDFRAGAGLNAQANRFLVGAGFAVRH